MIYKNFDLVKEFPVSIKLNTKNPWKNAVKVNNKTITTTNIYIVKSKEELLSFKAIEKYLIIESIENKETTNNIQTKENIIVEEPKKRKTSSKKSKE